MNQRVQNIWTELCVSWKIVIQKILVTMAYAKSDQQSEERYDNIVSILDQEV